MANITMRAARVHEYGGPEQIVFENIERPKPGPGEILIRVMAAGVNPVDWKIRSGMYKDWMPVRFPWTPGIDVSGYVEELGEGVKGFTPGQPVFGAGSGAYAEYAPVKSGDIMPKPDSIGFEEAAAIPVAALTAWKAIVEDGEVQAGQRVLIQGAAGGVGHFAVQLARWKGARVTGTASMDNAEFVRSLGAESVIDYRAGAFETRVHDMDLVFDTVGGDVTDRSMSVLKRGGTLLSVAGQGSPGKAKELGVRIKSTGRAPMDRLSRIVELIASNAIRTCISRTMSLEEARRAQELSQSGHGRGKIVLRVYGA